MAGGFDADSAAVWSHLRVGPADARAWERAGFDGGDLPSRAALWHHNRFTPAEAVAWGAMPGRSPGVWVFAPTIAMSFRDAGFTPARAWPWWRRGLNAALAEKWRDAGAYSRRCGPPRWRDHVGTLAAIRAKYQSSNRCPDSYAPEQSGLGQLQIVVHPDVTHNCRHTYATSPTAFSNICATLER